MSYTASIHSKILLVEELKRRVFLWKLQSKKIVFTNGCFDILHKGHVSYLMEAADHGNVMIVGLNSDESVKKLNKGSNRPLQDEQTRALILASLTFVSAVCIFNEETPEQLIKSIVPEVLVKGGDYTIDEIAGSKFVLEQGGIVKTIPLVSGFSTTNIVQKILKS